MPSNSRLLRHALKLGLAFVAAFGFVAVPSSPAQAASLTRAVDIALHQIGDPYGYGAAGPSRFDCSGLVYYSYRKAGYSGMPRTSSAQAAWLRPVRKSNMHRGDLMYFHHNGSVYHAAIFLRWKNGRALMLHSPKPGGHVSKTYAWTSEWFGRRHR